jgi:hypothetical protein
VGDPVFRQREIGELDVGLDDLTPEAAARVTVNDRFAGSFIGRPLRLDVTPHLKAGVNAIRIDPFAPTSARLAIISQ